MKEKNRLLLLILICCAIVLLVIFSFFIFNKLNIERNEIAGSMRMFDEIEKKTANDKNNERTLYDLKKEKEEIEKIIVANQINQENLALFIEYLESLASASFLNLSFESIQESQNKENYNFVLNVKAEGFFDNIYRFLSILENAPYFISADNLILTKNNSEKKEVKNAQSEWEVKMNLKILNLK